MTTRERWPLIGEASPEALVGPTLELHWAVQYLASIGQTFAEPREDDSHRAMSWNAELRAFVSSPVKGPYPFRAALRPADLTLLLIDRTDAELGALPLDGVRREEGYDWLATGLATYLGGAPPRIERPEYDMPSSDVSDGTAPFVLDPRSLTALDALYDTSAQLLTDLAGSRTDASAVLCWPHHFDIATLITLETNHDDEVTRTVGVGFAPVGGGYNAWYWYVTPYPYPDASSLPPLESPGHWHTDGWTGAVLTGDSVIDHDPDEYERVVRDFVARAVAAATEAHGATG